MENFLLTLIIALITVTLVFIGLGITILVRKGGKFPNTHIHGNSNLNSQGIHCVESMDREEQRKVKKKIDYRSLKLDTTGK